MERSKWTYVIIYNNIERGGICMFPGMDRQKRYWKALISRSVFHCKMKPPSLSSCDQSNEDFYVFHEDKFPCRPRMIVNCLKCKGTVDKGSITIFAKYVHIRCRCIMAIISEKCKGKALFLIITYEGKMEIFSLF